ncbi:UNVERIFIED_CONTAM: hypothetical protein FKN15_073499 [Acipenser sinensis]
MAGQLLAPQDSITLEQLVSVAVHRGYTAQGEMFSASNMGLLAEEVFPCRAQLLTGGMGGENRAAIIRHLATGLPLLIPYPSARSSSLHHHSISSFLLKKYMGYMYESLDQKDPVFDAKGIETVRRDTCPAVAKILERSVRLLFETRDISQIKQYVQRQCLKVLEGKASMQDLTFAKEYRGSNSYRPGACVPALEVTRYSFTSNSLTQLLYTYKLHIVACGVFKPFLVPTSPFLCIFQLWYKFRTS